MIKKTNSHQKLGFSVPENYFTTSKAQILDAIQNEKSTSTPMLNIRPWVAQLAAMFVLALATTWFLRQSNDELMVVMCNTQKNRVFRIPRVYL